MKIATYPILHIEDKTRKQMWCVYEDKAKVDEIINYIWSNYRYELTYYNSFSLAIAYGDNLSGDVITIHCTGRNTYKFIFNYVTTVEKEIEYVRTFNI